MLLHPLNFYLLITQFFLMQVLKAGEAQIKWQGLEDWRVTDQVSEIEGRWNRVENKCHINSLELPAAFFCLKAFCKNKTRLHVLLKLDNATPVAYINKKGGSFQPLVTN